MSSRADSDGKTNLVVDEKTSRRMARIRTEGTEPEMAVRRIVHSLGYRYTTSNGDLPGRPDLANRTRQWAIFVHGCFWHAHQECEKGTTRPKRNREFWEEKLRKNKERDARVVRELEDDGFASLVVWECELNDLKFVTDRLHEFLSNIY